MGYQKIKMKETAKYNSVKTKYFSIKKGQVLTLDDSIMVDPSSYDILEKNGEVLIKLDKLSKDAAVKLLGTENDPNILIDKFQQLDISYNDVMVLLEVETKKFKRKAVMTYLMEIPEPKDDGVVYGPVQIWMRELMSIKEIGQKEAMNVMTIYPTKTDLLNALAENQNIPLASEVEDALRREFKVQVEKEQINPDELRKARVELARNNTGATTREHFKFANRKK